MNITIKYGTGNEVQTNKFGDGTILSAVLTDASVKGALGYGDNIEGHIGGIPMGGGTILRSGDVVSVQDKACAKAHDDVEVLISYGTGNFIRRTYPAGTTAGQIIGDPAVKGFLGYGANVEPVIGGIPMSANTTIAPGDEVVVQDQACSKARH